ncbi:isochorismatase family protein [Streptomyces sp. NPDC020141]|uniref:isochorismatase family protein n=1 Tax=Streptomyces sp. NPDC020141 TaxID=3365065 RepID=UPI003798B465
MRDAEHGTGSPGGTDADPGTDADTGAGGFVRDGAWHSVPRRTAPEGPAQALVLVDAQRAFLTGPDAVPDAERLVGRLAALLERARDAGAVVVHLRNDGEPGAVDEPGAPGWELYFPVRRTPREHLVPKEDDDGFTGTPLGAILADAGVRRVVIGGVLSEMCVSATAAGAVERGLLVVLPHDAHATYHLDDIPASVVSRVAEHALGSDPEFVASSDTVRFTAPAPAGR